VTPQRIDDWYDSRYRPSGGRYVSVWRLTRRLILRRIARHLDAVAPPGSIIDIGAGEGELALILLQRGRKCLALDPYSRTRHVTRKRLEDLETLDEASCLVYWHSFEHIVDPSTEVRAMARLLPVGGIVVMALPNPLSIQAWVFGDQWHGLDVGRHLHLASERGLLTLLETAGFRRADHVWRGGDAGQGFGGWMDGLLRLTGWRSGVHGLTLANGEVPLVRLLMGVCLAIGLAPLAAALSILEVLVGRPGTTVVLARHTGAPSRAESE